MAENLEATRRLARREALEEAAKVADAKALYLHNAQPASTGASLIASGCSIIATIIAAEIRDLAAKEENTPCPPPKC